MLCVQSHIFVSNRQFATVGYTRYIAYSVVILFFLLDLKNRKID